MNQSMIMSKKHPIPIFNHPMIETHCHLDYLKNQSVEDTIAQAHSVGVERIITIAVSADNLPSVMDIAQAHDTVYGTQGIHPHDAEDYKENVPDIIRHNAQHEKIVAIGEIGLDYYYDHADRNVQRVAFESQLQTAIDLDLPVVIHTRDADEDTQAILGNFSQQMTRKGVIHSFTSGLPLAEFCLSEGFCLGFNGICTFKNAENVRDVVRITPLEQTLLETDSPYLTPVPYRGKENAPFYLPFIAEHIAEVKGITVNDVLIHAYQNSERVFFS